MVNSRRTWRFSPLGSVAVDVGVEERFGDDLEGEAHHGIVQVELLAGTPGLDEAGGAIGHGAGVIRDAIAVEGRLHHAALAEPKFAFAGEKAVAKEEAVGAEDAAFDEFTRIVDDDVFDVLGMEKGVGAEVEKAQADDVAVFAGVTRHEGRGSRRSWLRRPSKKPCSGPGGREAWGDGTGGEGERKGKFG